jgi:hypothetical protein
MGIFVPDLLASEMTSDIAAFYSTNHPFAPEFVEVRVRALPTRLSAQAGRGIGVSAQWDQSDG